MKWSVVAQVSDPDVLIRCFVAHYKALGAHEIFLFFDHENEALEAELAAIPQVFVQRNTLKHFKHNVGKRKIPGKKTYRQGLNASFAALQSSADWMLHCDVDEYLRPDAGFLAQLAEADDELGYFEVRNLERRFARDEEAGIFGGLAIDPDLYAGPDHPRMFKGCLGHVAGKPLVRTGRGYHIGVHRAKIGDPLDKRFPPKKVLQGTDIIHFDGMTPFHWAVKLMRRASIGLADIEKLYNGSRLLQIYEVFESGGDRDALRQLYEDVAITDKDAPWVKSIGIDVAKAHLDLFGFEPDLSRTSFDAALEPYFEAALQDVARLEEAL